MSLRTHRCLIAISGAGDVGNSGPDYPTIHGSPTGLTGSLGQIGQFYNHIFSTYFVYRGTMLFTNPGTINPVDLVSAILGTYWQYASAPETIPNDDFIRALDGTGLAPPDGANFGAMGLLTTPMTDDILLSGFIPLALYTVNFNAAGLSFLAAYLGTFHSFPMVFRTKYDIMAIPPDVVNGDNLRAYSAPYIDIVYNPTIVHTTPVDMIGRSSARLNGNLESDGGVPDQVQFSYWQTGGVYPAIYTPWMAATEGVPFHQMVTGLLPGTTYGVQVICQNSKGTWLGESIVFTTLPAYIISASAGINGAIAPSGNVPVLPGDDQAFAITPDPTYYVDDILVDGVSIGPVTTYTFYSVAADHTISATFTLVPPPPAPGNLQIIKNTIGADNIFSFSIVGPSVVADQTISTVGGIGAVTISGLTAGNYTVTEHAMPPGWHSNDPSLVQAVGVPPGGTGTAIYNNAVDAKRNLAYPLGRYQI